MDGWFIGSSGMGYYLFICNTVFMVLGECDLFHQQRGGLLYDPCYTALQRVNSMSSTCLQTNPREAQSGEGGGARRIFVLA